MGGADAPGARGTRSVGAVTRSTGFFPPQPGARKFPAASARLIVAIAVLGGAHILVRTSTHGAAVEWDSVEYLSAAESLAAGDGLGRPRLPDEFVQFVQWPPLFPMLLALFVPFGIEPVDAARFVNALAFGLTIALAGFWLRRHCGSRVLAVAGTVAVATAVPLCDVSSYVMTEPLFILFTLLALIGLESFRNRKDAAMPPLLLAAGCAALAALTRYVGVVGILVGVLLVLLRRDLPAAARLKFAAIYGAIPSVPLALVLARNWSVSGTLAGSRIVSGQSVFDGLGQTGDIFRAWLFVSTDPEWLSLSLSPVGAGRSGGPGISVVVARPRGRSGHPAVRGFRLGVSPVSPRRRAVDDESPADRQISHPTLGAAPVDGRLSAGQVAAP